MMQRTQKTSKIVVADGVREKLAEGIKLASDAVASTLGPSGRLVAISRPYGSPHITKDGVTVARSIRLSDPLHDLGARLMIDAADRCNRDVGDGTTTATLLAAHMVQHGLHEASRVGVCVADIKRGMDHAANLASGHIEARSIPCDTQEQIRHIATISANGDTATGDLVARAVSEVGVNGVVQIEDGIGLETTVELIDGVQWDRGVRHGNFMNDPRGMVTITDASIMCYRGRVGGDRESVTGILSLAAKAGRPVVLIATAFDDNFIANAAHAKEAGQAVLIPVVAPGVGEDRDTRIEDIAVLTGARVLGDGTMIDLEDTEPDDVMGTAGSFVSMPDLTTMSGLGGGELVAKRADLLKEKLASDRLTDYERQKLQERLSWMTGGVARVTIGASTDVELRELRDRFDDSLSAARAAVEQGIVAGGGASMLSASAYVEGNTEVPTRSASFEAGMTLVQRALEAPIYRISENAGGNPSLIVATLRQAFVDDPKSPKTYDAADRRMIDSAFEGGIIVPAKVEIAAIRAAVSVAGTMLQMSAAIVDEPDAAD